MKTLLLCLLEAAVFAVGAFIYALVALSRVLQPSDALRPMVSAVICIVITGLFLAGAHTLRDEW